MFETHSKITNGTHRLLIGLAEWFIVGKVETPNRHEKGIHPLVEWIRKPDLLGIHIFNAIKSLTFSANADISTIPLNTSVGVYDRRPLRVQ